jgi:hypothetical protein
MKHSTYFVQECPTCSRALHIQVKYLGRQLTCQHCRGKLEARHPEDAAPVNNSMALLQRADELLNQSRIA